MKKISVNKINLVHVVLGHSYLFYFLALMIGLLADVFIKIRIGGSSNMLIGFILILLGTSLIYIAQNTSRKAHHRKNDFGYTRFLNGPYKFTRSPTHLGLAITMVGLSFVLQSFSLLFCSFLAFLFTRYIFIRKEEKILTEN